MCKEERYTYDQLRSSWVTQWGLASAETARPRVQTFVLEWLRRAPRNGMK